MADGSSFAQVAGMIITDGKTVKLRPAGIEDYHILYEVKGKKEKKEKKDKFLLQLNKKSKSEAKARWVEAKGIQRDFLAEMPEASFSIGIRGSLTGLQKDLLVGEIGQLEIMGESDLQRAVEVLTPYYGLTGSETFAFKHQVSRAGNDIYELSQSINGVNIIGGNLRLYVSKTSHKITRVRGSLLADKGFATEPIISEEDAKSLALDYMITNRGGLGVQFEAFEAGLFYSFAHSSKSDALQLNWGFEIHRNGNPVNVLVDTDSGEVTVMEIVEELTPRARVCEGKGDSSSETTNCDNHQVIIGAYNDCLAARQQLCSQARYTVPRDTVLASGAMWEDLMSTGCCAVGVGGIQDIVINVDLDSPTALGNYYALRSFYGGNWKATMRISKSASPTNKEITEHEMGHALFFHLAPEEVRWLGNSGSNAVKREHKAVKEGVAHINAIVQKNYGRYPKFSSPTWIYTGWDISNHKVYEDDFINSDDQEHENGLILANAFYELVIQDNGVSFQQASTLFFESIAEFDDINNDQGLSFSEVRAAMEVIAGSNQNTLNAVQNAWGYVGVGSSGSGGCALEAPYGPINATSESCNNDGTSVWTIYWGDRCPSATSYYELWYSQPDGTSYVKEGNVSKPATTPVTVGVIINGDDARVKVKSCNASNQCSSLSSHSTVVYDFCD